MENDVCKKENFKVIKRDGKRVDFNEGKIGVAITKTFNSIEDSKYTEEDTSRVFAAVIDKINEVYGEAKSVKVEEIQDIIEDTLRNLEYLDVMENFNSYREKRKQSREVFESYQHKLVKELEALSLKDAKDEDSKRDNANVDGDTAMGTMLHYGSTISKAFSKSHFMEKRFADAHDSGMIHIHDMDFMPMGTTTCCQIDLNSLFEKGFSTGHGFL